MTNATADAFSAAVASQNVANGLADSLSVTIVADNPAAISANANAFCMTVAVFGGQYVPPIVATPLPCQSWCLPLYYIREHENV